MGRQARGEAIGPREETFAQLLESIPHMIWMASPDGSTKFLNRRAVDQLGVAGAGAHDWGWLDLLHPDDAARSLELWQACVAGATPYSHEYRVRWADGTYRWVLSQAEPVRDRRGKVRRWIGTWTDIDALKQTEEQLRHAQKMESIGRLAGGIAHDFNNLLTVIGGYTEVLLRSTPEGDPRRPALEEIRRAAERSAALTRQLLAFGRNQVLAPEVLDLGDVVRYTRTLLGPLIGEDVRLETRLYPRLDPVRADPRQVQEVLLNLVVNARDAMPRGGRLVIETANVVLDEAYAAAHPRVRPGRYVLLAVTDAGSGMTDEVKAHLFEPFFTTKPKGAGTGLGLAVVDGIVEQSGGHIEFESELGVGSSFKIYLPSERDAPSSAGTAIEPDPAARGSETILLVEDETAVRGLARFALEDRGYTVLEAGHGEEGLAVASAHPRPIDLLVTDVVMPGMGGPALAERLAVVYPALKVLFVSGYTDDAVVRQGLLKEQVSFLQKPFTPSALARKVRKVLGR